MEALAAGAEMERAKAKRAMKLMATAKTMSTMMATIIITTIMKKKKKVLVMEVLVVIVLAA